MAGSARPCHTGGKPPGFFYLVFLFSRFHFPGLHHTDSPDSLVALEHLRILNVSSEDPNNLFGFLIIFKVSYSKSQEMMLLFPI
jgi:hypothetical protein